MVRAITLQKGLSLIELMIAMLIGLVVIAAVIQTFVSSRQVYRVQNAKAHIQENGRYAVHLLSEVIQDAGFQGCGSFQIDDADIDNNLANPAAYDSNYAVPIQGNDWDQANTVWSPVLDATITTAVQGSDVITVRGPLAPETHVIQHSNGSNQITLGAGHSMQAADQVMISDCESAAIANVDAVNTNILTLNQNLDKAYENGWISRMLTKSYYIRTNPDGRPALYSREGLNVLNELVSNVETIQLSYGVDTDTDGSADAYSTADVVADWSEVVSVRLELVAVSEEDNLTVNGPQSYFINGGDITPADRRLRSVFTRTITLRNRVP